MVTAILAVMAKSARSMVFPTCYVCRRDGIFDRTARHPAAAVRVGICREPYALDVCERHLGPLQATLPTGGLWVIERYRRQPDGISYSSQVQQPARIEAILSSRHLPNDLDQPVSRSSVPTVGTKRPVPSDRVWETCWRE